MLAAQIDYAWAAGFFDGEGCVSLSDCTRKDRGYTSTRHITMKILVSQKVRLPLDKLLQLFGGTIEPSRRAGVSALGGPFNGWVWIIRGTGAAEALTKMLPYLVLKREVTMVALDLQAHIDNRPRKGRGCPLSDEDIEYRKALLAKARWLNSGHRAAATTKPSGSANMPGSDSLNCTDGKDAEVAEMSTRLQ